MQVLAVRGRQALLFLLMGLLMLTACGSPQWTEADSSTDIEPASPSVTSHRSGQVTDLTSLVDILRAKGLNVEQGDSASQPFFSVQGTTLKVEGADVQVFEYADAEAAKADMAKIGPDGNPPTMMIEWVEPPHFYQGGRLIVLYVGDDEQIKQTLSVTLGPQVAGR